MNKKIYNEDLTLNLILNGDKLQKGNKLLLGELYKLDQETRKLQLSVAKLELDKRKLNKTDTDYANKLHVIQTEIDQLNRKITSNYQAMMQMRKEIGLASLTINQLNSHLKVLKAMLYNATDPTIIKRLRKEIDETTIRITTMTTGASRMSQTWTKFARDANKYSAAIGWISIVVFGVSTAIGNLVERLGLLDRKLSGVMKTSGLTREEAYKLAREFDRMYTPTKTDDLLDIARIAGMLGVKGYADIEKFTKAVDILQIALGEDLNTSVEETATKVGKLVNAFRITDELPIDEALLRTGSLLNELDKASVASAGTILEYMTRLSSLGTSANYPMEALAGIGAAMESVNIPAERGSTALRNIISGLGKYADKFSRILGISVDEYKKWVETDINGVFLKLIELTAKGDKSILDVVNSMGDFEVSGVRAAEIFAALAKNIDVVKQQQEIAKKAFQSSDSVMSEFLITLKDYQSAIDLQKKEVAALAKEYRLSLADGVLTVYKLWVDFLYILRDTTLWIGQHGRQILALIPLYAAWKSTAIAIWLKDVAYAIKFYTVTTLQSIKATIANNVVFIAWQRHGIKGAIIALRSLWATMAVNPMAPFIAIIGIAAAAFMFFTAKTDLLKNAMGELSADMIKARGDLNGIFEELKKAGDGTEKRAALIKTINEQYGQYLPQMLTEADNLATIEAAQLKANTALENSIALKWKESTFDKMAQENAEKRAKAAERALSWIDKSKGSSAFGAASGQLDKLSADVLSGKNTDPNAFMNFGNSWGLMNIESTRKAFNEYVDLIKEQLVEKQRLDAFMAGYGSTGTPSGGESTGGPLTKDNIPRMSEDDFKLKNKNLETENAVRKTLLNLRKMDDEQRKMAELQEEKRFLQAKLNLQNEYDAKDESAVAGLNLQLSENTKAMRELGIKNIAEIERLENEHGLDLAKIKNKYLKGEIKTEAEYNDEVLKSDLLFLSEKLKNYKEGSKEYIDTYNEFLEKKVNAENSVNAKLLAAQKQFARIRTDRIVNELDKSIKEEEDRWEEEKQLFENQLIVKSDLNDKEIELNDTLHSIIEAKEKEHQEKLRKIKAVADNPMLNNLKNTLSGMGQTDKGVTYWNRDEMDSHFAQKNALIKQQYELEKQMAGDNQKELQEADNNFQKASMDLKVEMFNAEIEMHDAKIKMAQEYVTALIGIVGQQSTLGKALFIFNQGLAIAGVWIKAAAANAAITSEALAMFAWMGPAAPAAAAAWVAAPLAANNTSAALNTGLILAQTVGTIVSQWEKGRYPVIGADDGQQYMAEWRGQAKTGIYSTPSLIAEKGPEMVIDYPTLRNIQMNAPRLINAIMANRVPQYAGAKYNQNVPGSRFQVPSAGGSGGSSGYGGAASFDVERFDKAVERLENIKWILSIQEYEAKKENWKKVTSGGLRK